MRLAIIGRGFLGRELERHFSQKYSVITGTSDPLADNSVDVDATNKKSVEDFIIKYKPKIVIDTVALTSSVACEKDPGLCKKLNYETAKIIAETCGKFGSKMIFISSSYVFEGLRGDYKETDRVNPRNRYAENKVLAEKEVLKNNNFIVLRTEPMYGIDGANGKLRFGTGDFDREVNLGVSKKIRKPVFIEDVSQTIEKLIETDSKGIFHIAGPKKFYWNDFVKNLASLTGNEEKINIVDDSGWIVETPFNSSLDTYKIRRLGTKINSFKEASEKILNQLYR